jgi:hypothetical protein
LKKYKKMKALNDLTAVSKIKLSSIRNVASIVKRPEPKANGKAGNKNRALLFREGWADTDFCSEKKIALF